MLKILKTQRCFLNPSVYSWNTILYNAHFVQPNSPLIKMIIVYVHDHYQERVVHYQYTVRTHLYHDAAMENNIPMMLFTMPMYKQLVTKLS